MSWLASIGFDYYKDSMRTNVVFARRIRYFLYIALVLSIALLAVDIFFKEIARSVHQNFFIEASAKILILLNMPLAKGVVKFFAAAQ